MSEARWSDLAVAAAAADKPSSGSSDPILTGPQAARRAAHKVATSLFQYTISWVDTHEVAIVSFVSNFLVDHKAVSSLFENTILLVDAPRSLSFLSY